MTSEARRQATAFLRAASRHLSAHGFVNLRACTGASLRAEFHAQSLHLSFRAGQDAKEKGVVMLGIWDSEAVSLSVTILPVSTDGTIEVPSGSHRLSAF